MRRPRRSSLALAAALAAIAAAVLLIVLAVGNGSSPGNPMRIETFARQYSWRFGYPAHNNAFSQRELHVPVGRPVIFEMHSADVLHGFWVPEWEVNVDTVPGDIEEVEVTPDEAGVFQLICSQNCGILHEGMRAKIVVEEPAEFDRWVEGLPPLPSNLRRLARFDREARAIRESLGQSPSG